MQSARNRPRPAGTVIPISDVKQPLHPPAQRLQEIHLGPAVLTSRVISLSNRSGTDLHMNPHNSLTHVLLEERGHVEHLPTAAKKLFLSACLHDAPPCPHQSYSNSANQEENHPCPWRSGVHQLYTLQAALAQLVRVACAGPNLPGLDL